MPFNTIPLAPSYCLHSAQNHTADTDDTRYPISQVTLTTYSSLTALHDNWGPPATTHTCLTALCPGLPRWAGTRKVKPIWILLEQETVSHSGISWAICKSAPCSRQITTPALHYSSFLQAECPSCCPTNSVKALKAVTTSLKFRGWEPVSLNAVSPRVLHTSGTVYLTSSLATWTSLQTLTKRNWKRFIALTATRRSTWPLHLRFIMLMTDTRCAKWCKVSNTNMKSGVMANCELTVNLNSMANLRMPLLGMHAQTDGTEMLKT